MLVLFFKEEKERRTYGLQVHSKCSYYTELTRVAEKGKNKVNVSIRKGETCDVHVYCNVLCFACCLQDDL